MLNDPVRAKEYFAAKLAFTAGPAELERMTRGDEVRVIDVRSEGDFKKEHIPGSINLPRSRWSTLEGLAKDRVNVVLCYSLVCHLAAEGALFFAERGFSVMELEGGFKGWKEHKLPVESGEAPRAQVDKLLAELRMVQDELRVQMHLAGLDAKDKWRDLETRFLQLEKQIGDATDSTLQKMRDAAVELKAAYHALRNQVSRHPPPR